MKIGTGHSALAADFIERIAGVDTPYVLELGTRRSEPGFATHHRDWLPKIALHTKCDIEDGEDVDEVYDAHRLPLGWQAVYDGVIAVAVFEHLVRPWVAAAELARVLTRGGLVFVSTHHTFPLHGYPDDYWRFSAQALASIFQDAGLEMIGCSYQYPCQIVPGPEVTRWNPAAPAYLNVELLAMKS